MYTSLFLAALVVPSAESLKWQDSYQTARQAGREQSKPLAVFIGSGPMGWKAFIDEGSLPEKTQKALSEGYVCLYVDRDKAAGKQLAEQFDAPTGTGLVFSSRDGESQAFFHAGKLSAAEFGSRVTKYAGTGVAYRTESINDSRVSFSYDPKSAPAQGTTGRPVMTGSYPIQYGTFGGFSGGFGGGCPNCRR